MNRSLLAAAAAVLALVACGGAPPPTHPPATVAVPPGVVRYLAGGDSRDDASHVVPWAFGEARARGATAFFFLGDMELSPQLDAHFRRELDQLQGVLFLPVVGNHEVKIFGEIPIGQAQAEDAFRKRFLDSPKTPVQSALPGKVVYSVNLPGGVHFVALDNVSQPGFGADHLAWLASDLDRARADGVKHVIVGMHKPLAKNGVSTHGMDGDGAQAVADSDAALALFQKARVDVVLASHVHEFARFVQGGIPSYISGGLGAPLTPSGPEHAFHHFLVLDVSDGAVRVDVVRFDGTPSMGTDEIRD